MQKQVVRLSVHLSVKEGKLEEFKSIAQAMTTGSEAEPGTLGYEWFEAVDGKRFRLLETYSDSAAVEAHFKGPVVQQSVPKLAALCTVEAFEIYGDPGPTVAGIAGGLGAVVYQYSLGLNR
jgi:quinol monooxygenase YgiN